MSHEKQVKRPGPAFGVEETEPEPIGDPVKDFAAKKQELADKEAALVRLQAEVDRERAEVHAGRRHYFGPPGPPVDVDA